MPRRSLVYAAVAVLVAAAMVALTRPALSATAAVRIMPLGDSITAGPGCWRALLWDRLQKAGYTNIDFVGTQSGGGCSVPLDPDHEGHAGMSATGIASQNLLPGWLSATNPNIVLMHLGTNDMWGNYIPTADILTAYGTLVDQLRANNPAMKIIVAQIIPMNPSSCPECAQEVVALDAAIPAWAAARSTAQSPIVVVDQWTGFDTATDTGDGVHPNASGDQKMANRWYPALAPLLTGATGSASPTAATSSRSPSASASASRSASASASPSRSASASASPSRSASASPSRSASASASPSRSASASVSASPQPGGCSVAYSVASQWPGSFQGTVKITNTGATAVSGWTLTWTFGNGQVVSQLWNGSVSQSAATVRVVNAGYNGVLAAGGGSAEVGFLASWNNSANAKPTSFTLNNVTCATA